MSFMPAPPEQPVLSVHPDKHIISLTGKDVRDFLNDILTAQINTLASDTARAACLLSPQGRILFDMMVMTTADTVFLITEAEQVAPLAKRLKTYRLRRKIEIAVSSNLCAGHIWGEDLANFSVPNSCISAYDERHKALGKLVLFSKTDGMPEQEEAKYWQALRINLGIPEGAADLTPNRALMLEAGLHLLGAIDFEKGCYVGQEVTARTHYRGLVKRRLVPITSEHPLKPGLKILRGDLVIGHTCSSIHLIDETSIALANLRLDAIQAVLESDETLTLEKGENIELETPHWLAKSLPF